MDLNPIEPLMDTTRPTTDKKEQEQITDELVEWLDDKEEDTRDKVEELINRANALTKVVVALHDKSCACSEEYEEEGEWPPSVTDILAEISVLINPDWNDTSREKMTSDVLEAVARVTGAPASLEQEAISAEMAMRTWEVIKEEKGKRSSFESWLRILSLLGRHEDVMRAELRSLDSDSPAARAILDAVQEATGVQIGNGLGCLEDVTEAMAEETEKWLTAKDVTNGEEKP